MPSTDPETPPEYRYHLLRAALAAKYPSLEGLDPATLAELGVQAQHSFALESLVLTTAEAAARHIAPEQLDAALAAVRERYPDDADFHRDLERNGLDESLLRRALHRELVFDACLQAVGNQGPAVSDMDVRLYYRLHQERFHQPERRAARQILITVNKDFAENQPAAARRRIEELADSLRRHPQHFPRLAQRHSECPSALEAGRLGVLARGQLYPALDQLLFSLAEGAVGGPLESELGWHLLWCEKIYPPSTQPFSRVQESIRRHLEQRAVRGRQRDWIAALRRTTTGASQP